MGEDRYLDPEEWRADLAAEERLVALVVRVRDERHAGGDELGARRVDRDDVAIGPVEGDRVVGAVALAVLELGLRHGGAERDVPQRRSLGLVRLAARKVAQEGALRHGTGSLVDGLVGHATSRR